MIVHEKFVIFDFLGGRICTTNLVQPGGVRFQSLVPKNETNILRIMSVNKLITPYQVHKRIDAPLAKAVICHSLNTYRYT